LESVSFIIDFGFQEQAASFYVHDLLSENQLSEVKETGRSAELDFQNEKSKPEGT